MPISLLSALRWTCRCPGTIFNPTCWPRLTYHPPSQYLPVAMVVEFVIKAVHTGTSHRLLCLPLERRPSTLLFTPNSSVGLGLRTPATTLASKLKVKPRMDRPTPRQCPLPPSRLCRRWLRPRTHTRSATSLTTAETGQDLRRPCCLSKRRHRSCDNRTWQHILPSSSIPKPHSSTSCSSLSSSRTRATRQPQGPRS